MDLHCFQKRIKPDSARQGFIVLIILYRIIKTYIFNNQNKQELIFVIAFSSFLTFSNSSLALVSMPPVLTRTSSNLVFLFRTGIKSCSSSYLGHVRLFVSEKFVL